MTTLSLRDLGFLSGLGGGDPYFANVSLLLHSNGVVPTDSSLSPKTITVSGNVRISNEQPKFGGSSLTAGTSPDFTWGSNRLQVPAGVDFAYGTNDFTVEAWLYNTTFNGEPSWFAQSAAGTNYFVCGVLSTGVPFFNFAESGGGTVVTGPVLAINTWNHVAIVRRNGVVTVYTNGTGGTPVSCAQNFSDMTVAPTIGSYSHTTGQLVYKGFIYQLRITKNIARDGADLTPLTVPFPYS
jgi:hypothetical protein